MLDVNTVHTTDPLAKAQALLGLSHPILVVNFHQTPPHRRNELDDLFGRIALAYAPVTPARLDAFSRTGQWTGSPGVILSFFDGYRNNFEVARPLLDFHGLVGWFFVVSNFVSAAPDDQADFARAHHLCTPVPGEVGERCAMSWDELGVLGGHHVVASHTRNHCELNAPDPDRLRDEIIGAQDDFLRHLGVRATAIAGRNGGQYGDNPLADALIAEARYQYLFSNLRIQRLPCA